MMAGLWAPRDWLRDIDSEDFQQSADQIIGTVMPAIDAAKSQATDAIQSTAQAGVQAYQQAATSLPKFTIPSISSLTAGWGDSTSQPSTATDQLDTTSTGVEAPTTSSQPAASPLSRFTIPNLTSLLSGWEAPKPPETVDSTATSTPAPSGAATVSAPSMPTAPPSAQPTAPVSLPARLDTSSRDANLAQWAPALQDTERRTGLRADALAAIIQAENGGGQSPLSAKDNNYFSISYVPGRPNQAGPGTGGRFAAYATPQDSLNDFVDLIQKHYPEAWANRSDPQKFFQGLVKGGYIVEEPGFPVSTWMNNLETGRQHFAAIAPAPAPATQAPGTQAPPAPGSQADDVAQAALDDPDKWALCGPVAAVIAAQTRGQGWTVADAKRIAQAGNLWDASKGMHGLESQVTLLNRMSINAKTGPADQGRLAADAQAGNTPIISTNRHYFVLKGYDPATGRFDTTTTGTALKGGSRWLTLDQISNLGNGIQGAAYIDNPTSPTPSVVASASSSSTAAPSASPTSQSRPLSQDASTLIPSSAAASSQTLSPSASDTAAGNLFSADQPTMYRQPLGMPTAGPDTTDVGSPTGPPVRDDYATAGSSVPAAVPSAQAIPQEDPTAIPRPAYVPPAMPLVTAPDQTIPNNTQQNPTISDAGPARFNPLAGQTQPPQPGELPPRNAPPPSAPLLSQPAPTPASSTAPYNPLANQPPAQPGELPARPGLVEPTPVTEVGAVGAATRGNAPPPAVPDVVQAVNRGETVNPFHWANQVSDAAADQVVQSVGIDPESAQGIASKFVVSAVVNPINWEGGAFSATAEAAARAGLPFLRAALPAIAERFGAETAGRVSTWLASQGSELAANVAGQAAAGAVTNPEAPGVGAAFGGGTAAVLGPAGRVIGRGVGAVGSELRAGAERAATVEAERAGQTSISAAGTLGVVPPAGEGSTIGRGGAPMEKPPVWTTSNTTVFDPEYPAPGLLESTGVPPTSPRRLTPDTPLYHLTSSDQLERIADSGLTPAVGDVRPPEVFLPDGSRATRRPGVYAADNAGILSAVDRDVYGQSVDWSLLRFTRGNRRWARDPEFADPGSWVTRNTIPPSDIEVFNGSEWVPVGAVRSQTGPTAIEPPGRPTSTYGVFGVAPPEAGPAAEAVARPRFVPPDVRERITPNVELPDDPRFQQAVENVGGQITDRGIELHVTRAQGETAAGQTATRGGVFVEPVRPGGRSSYVTSSDNPNGVGGAQVLPPTRTLYRKPLVVDEAPGAARGFDAAMRQLVPSSPEMESLVQRRVAAYEELQAARGTGKTGNINRAQAALDAINEQITTLHPTDAAIDAGIRAARAAGPEGSPARAAALKALVSRYGGDPALIDPLLRIRGADASESAWAIKENIVATNARKRGYDGVFTMEDTGEPNWKAINQHPLVMKADQDFKAANAALSEADAAHQTAPTAANWRAYQQAEQAAQAAADAYKVAQQEAERLVGTAKLTEILDVQQGRNPTPGQLTQESRAAQIRYRAAENQYQGAIKNGSFGTDELSALRDARDRAKAEFDRVGTQFSRPPGYSLHPDVVPPSQGAAATAGITPVPVRQHTDVLASVNKALSQGVASAVSGGVGAATNQQLNPDDPNAALKGFAVGAVAPFALSRGARALATRAGRGAGPVEGALGVFGVGGRPKAQAVTNAADPTIRRVGQMMEGDYQIKTPPDPRTTAQRLGDAFAVAWTDNRAGLYRLQNSVSEALGRKLQPDEMVAELSRLNPASTASQRLSENLRPALQQVGEDQDWLSQYLVHSHNVDVAREMGQRAYETAITAGKAPAEASRLAVIAADTRQFSGDLNLAQTQKALTDIEATVKGFPDGTQRWQAIQDGAQAVWGHNRETLQRKLDAGLISQDLFNDLTQKYPRYVRTDIADYFERGSGAAKPAGRTIGTSDVGIQKLDPKGTGKDRVNPLLSTIDQTYTAESAIQRNVAGKAFEQLVDADPTWANTFREVVPQRGPNVGNPQTTVPGAYRLRGNEQFLTVWDKGDSRTFVIPGEFASLVSPQGGRVLGDSALANGWRSMMGIYKGLITSRNPAFSLVVSPIRDAGDYAIREAVASARHQGPLGAVEAVGALPGVIKDYVAAVPAAFSGILQGQFRGDLAAMMRAGAGQMSRPGHTDKELRRALGELSSAGGIQVRDLGDLRRLVGNVVTLGAGPVGERLEQVPRLAAARRAATRGASTTEQVMAFRDATVDFQRGGDLAKSINAAVPFFNTSIQGGAQVARTARQNPAAFLSSVAATIGLATAGAEAWNNSDPQRAQDYQDVPDYLKKTGIIFMLPGVTGTDQRGDRRPNFAWVPTGNYGALVGAARDAIQKSGQEQGGADLSTLSGWGSLAADVAGTFSPLRGDSAGSALTSLIPPPLSTAADLVGNKDLYRGTTIATDRADQNASALAAGSASAFNRATGQETRPSQWDYLYRDLGGFAAGAAGEASNMLAEEAGLRPRQQEQRPIQDFPVAGGMVGRVIRDSVGRGLQTAQDERNRVPESIRPILQEAGLRREQVAPVPSTLQNIPLTRAEQADWQDRTNGYIEREVDQASRSAAYRARGADQQKIIQDAIAAARSRAANEVFRQIPPAERSQRLRDAQAQKAS